MSLDLDPCGGSTVAKRTRALAKNCDGSSQAERGRPEQGW